MWLLIVFIIYLALLAVIGAYCARFNRTLADFVLGGRPCLRNGDELVQISPWYNSFAVIP